MPPSLATLFLLGLAAFGLGFVSGIHVGSDDYKLTKKNLRIIVGILVTVVWIVTIGAEILIASYTVSVLIHGIMGGVVGYLFSDEGVTLNFGG
jgi:hypothetical protein